MASNDPGLATIGATAEDPQKGAYQQTKQGQVEEDHPVAPDQFDERFETSRWEIWYLESACRDFNLLTS